jgi:hypothetical protein
MAEIEGKNGGRLTPFPPGQSGNPGGKTSEQKRREMRNAEMATRLQEFLLEREIAAIDEPADLEASALVRETLKDVLSPSQLQTVLSTLTVALTGERLKLIKDAQDRGLGAPTQTLAGDAANPVGIALVERVIVDAPKAAD